MNAPAHTPRAAVIGAVVAVLLIAGCTPSTPDEAAEDDTLTVGRVRVLDGLSGDSCVGDSSISAMPMIYGQLLTPSSGSAGLDPGLLSDYTYDAESHAYSLVIAGEAMFSDGEAVDSADLAFSIDQWRKGPTSGAYYENISAVEIRSDREVRVTMAGPDTFFPALLSWCTSTLYPDAFGGRSSEDFFTAPVGAGPYRLVSWDFPGSSEVLTFASNKHGYLNTAADDLVPNLVIRVSSEMSQQLLAFEAGELDIVEDIGADDVAQLPAERVVASDPSYVMDLMVNSTRPALSDPRVRQAISLAIDRSRLVEALYEKVEPAAGILPTNIPNSVLGSGRLRFDPDRARELLAEAGATGLSLDLGYESGQSTTSNTANLLERQLGEVGITVNLKPVDQASTYTLAASGEFDLLMSGVTAISPTAFDPIGFLRSVWYPWTGADMSVIDAEYANGTATFENAQRDRSVAAVQDDALAQSTVIGLYNQPSIYAVARRVSGFEPTTLRYWQSSNIRIDSEDTQP